MFSSWITSIIESNIYEYPLDNFSTYLFPFAEWKSRLLYLWRDGRDLCQVTFVHMQAIQRKQKVNEHVAASSPLIRFIGIHSKKLISAISLCLFLSHRHHTNTFANGKRGNLLWDTTHSKRCEWKRKWPSNGCYIYFKMRMYVRASVRMLSTPIDSI